MYDQQYTSIKSAMSACWSDAECYAIHDYGCDDVGKVSLCRGENYTDHNKLYIDCIYRKQGNFSFLSLKEIGSVG